MSEISRNGTSHSLSTKASSPPPSNGKPTSSSKGVRPGPDGLFRTSDSTKISTLNGSHKTICDDEDHESVLVFPDFKVVTEVRRSVQGAQDLWDSAVNPELGRNGAFLEKSPLKTWVLPYSCVILLCTPFFRSCCLRE